MDDLLARAWGEIVARLEGPLSFRFILQPLVAALLAVLAGARDARTGRRPFLLTLVTNWRERPALLRSAWRDVGMVFLVAVVLDVAYQLGVLRGVRPLQTLFVAAALAFVPYVVIRGLATRVARAWNRRGDAH